MQVREQARANALQIRTDVQRRRERELQLLAEELRQDWELQQSEKIQALQRLYEESLRLLGQGHRSAKENVSRGVPSEDVMSLPLFKRLL